MNQTMRYLIGAAVMAGIAGGAWILQPKRATVPTPVVTPASGDSDITMSSGTIGAGGSLSQSLTHAGVPAVLESQIEKTLKPSFNPRYVKPEDRYEVYFSAGHRFIKLTYWPDAFSYYVIQQQANASLTVTHEQLAWTESVVGVHGQIKVSLWQAMTEQGVPPEMIYRFAELFSWRFDFLTEPRQGDEYKLIWKRRRTGDHTRDGEIVAAWYHSDDKGDLYAYPLAGDYFDADGNTLRGEFLRAPLAYRRISSYFTERRFHPILRIYRPHHGIDYSAAMGTPAVSIGDGVVTERGWGGDLGNEIRIRHAGDYISIYGHLRGFAKGTAVGSHVKQGQVVGFVGSTGLSTGPHLHFGFEHNGKLMNFFALKMLDERQSVTRSERAQFDQVKKEDSLLFNRLTTVGTPLQTLSTPDTPK